jgi:hypothetical protein
LVLVIAAMALSSCSSGHARRASTRGSTTTSTTLTTAARADLQLAQRAQLNVDDVPAEFQAVPSDNQDTGDLGDEVERCVKSIARDVVVATGLDGFESDNKGTVGAKVIMFNTTNAADTFLTKLDSDAFRTCLIDGVRRGIQQSATQAGSSALITGVTDQPLAFAALGDRTVAQRVTATIKAGSIEVPSFTDAVFIRRGRAVAMLLCSNAPIEPEAPIEDKAGRAMADRLPSQTT